MEFLSCKLIKEILDGYKWCILKRDSARVQKWLGQIHIHFESSGCEKLNMASKGAGQTSNSVISCKRSFNKPNNDKNKG